MHSTDDRAPTHLACLNTRFRDACRQCPNEFMNRRATADLQTVISVSSGPKMKLHG